MITAQLLFLSCEDPNKDIHFYINSPGGSVTSGMSIYDVMQYVPFVRPGGYFILHDYYGWFDKNGVNNSPIKRVVDEIPHDRFERILIDTGYPSFVIFHRPKR